MGSEPTLEWSASSTNAAQNPNYVTASASWTHDWGTITTGSAEEGTLFVRNTIAGAIVTSLSMYVCDDGASTWGDPLPSDGWIEGGTAATDEMTFSSAASLDITTYLSSNSTDSALMLLTVPGGASGGTQAFDYRMKYTWA